MTIIVRVPGVFDWHPEIVTFSLDLIDTFVRNVEEQAEQFIIKYEEGKELIEDDDGLTVFEVHQGLDGSTHDLETVYRQYFPSLHRSSALLTLWGFFEQELDGLCALYQSEKRIKLSVSDLAESGISRSTRYLERVAGLNMHKTSKEWATIKKMQKLRNAIAHRGGKLSDEDDKEIRKFVNATDSLSLDDDQIVIGKGFVTEVVTTYRGYFKLIGDSISAMREMPEVRAPASNQQD